MGGMFTRRFWVDATERAVSTGAQAAVAVIGADVFSAIEADWVGIGSVALGGVILSYLKALAAVRSTGTAAAVKQ